MNVTIESYMYRAANTPNNDLHIKHNARHTYNFLLYQQHRQKLQITARKMAAPATINGVSTLNPNANKWS